MWDVEGVGLMVTPHLEEEEDVVESMVVGSLKDGGASVLLLTL